MRGAAQGTTRVESRYTIQTCDPSVSRTAVRWGPQFFFERPAKIPRSFLRSFSLWARHPAETSAELNVRLGAAEFFPGQQAGATAEEAAEGRKCEGGAGNGFGSRVGYTIQTCDSVAEQNRCQVGPTILFECPAKIPRSFLLPTRRSSDLPAETSAELNVRLGAAEFFP